MLASNLIGDSLTGVYRTSRQRTRFGFSISGLEGNAF
jgi:hypothetical protein